MAANSKPMTWPERIVAVGLILGAIWGVNSCSEWSAQKAAQREAVKALRAAELSRVGLTNFSWRKGGFGSVMIANFTIENGLDRDIADVRVECRVTGRSGTTIGTPWLMVYEVVKTGKSRNIKDMSVGFVHSQSTNASCSVADFKRL